MKINYYGANVIKTICFFIVFLLFFCSRQFHSDAAQSGIDFVKPENYFYDKFYPDSSAELKVIENYDKAVREFEKKDIIKAFFYLNNMLKYSQFSKEANNLYGVLLMYNGDYENAAEFFRKSSNQDRKYKWPYINQGLIFYDIEDWRKLESVASAYLKVCPDDFEANLGMGLAAFYLYCFEDADGYLKKAYDARTGSKSEDFIKVLNEYRARVRAKLRRLY